MIIQFLGWGNSDKTQIADAVRDRINGLHISQEDSYQLLKHDDEVDYAENLGFLARFLENKQDKPVIVDCTLFTEKARKAFGPADIIVWVDTVLPKPSFWEDPDHFDHKIEITNDSYEDALPTRAITVIRKFGIPDWKVDTTMIIGKFQTFDRKDVDVYNVEKSNNDQVVFGVRHVVGMTDEDKLHFEDVVKNITKEIPDALIIKLPNITNIGEKNV